MLNSVTTLPVIPSKGLTVDSFTVGYDPYDDDSESGYKRPPRLIGCIIDYFRTITIDCDVDNPFPTKEMDAMLADPTNFFMKSDVIVVEVPAYTIPLPKNVVRQNNATVLILKSKSTGEQVPRLF